MAHRRPGPGRPAALLWGGCAVVAAQLGLALALDHGPAAWRDREYGLRLARLQARRDANPGRPLLLALGSSRVAVGFRPVALPVLRDAHGREVIAFNFGALGAGPAAELVWLRRLLRDGVRPDWLLVEFWPPYWEPDSRAEEGRVLQPERLSWADIRVLERLGGRDGTALRRAWIQDRLFPWHTHRRPFLADIAPRWHLQDAADRDRERWLRPDATGWISYLDLWEPAGIRPPRAQVERDWQRFAAGLARAQFTGPPARAFEELLALCRREGIQPLVAVLPEGREFQALYPPGVRTAAAAYLRHLTADLSVPVVDARDWSLEADFPDGYHLFPTAAARFTGRLGREFLEPLPTATTLSECGSRQRTSARRPWSTGRPCPRP